MSNFVDLHNAHSQTLIAKTSKVIAEFDARGGVSESQPGGALQMDPTPPGEYLIAWREAHVSTIWRNSKIAWGTPVRLNNSQTELEVQIKGKWQKTTSIDPELTLDAILTEYNMILSDIDENIKKWGIHDLPKVWRLNDFGPTAVLLYQDEDHNRKFSAKNDKIRQEMFHTTPKNHLEAQFGKDVTLDDSHGCIHIKPNDMLVMLKAGYFNQNNTVIVHTYDEGLPNYSIDSTAKPPYTIHFYPGQLKILVYGK